MAGPVITDRTTVDEEKPSFGQRLLGQLDTPLTSYYLIVASGGLLLLIGLVMVLSASSVTSLADTGNPYLDFLNQVKYAAVGLILGFIVSRLPPKVFQALAWPALGAAFVLSMLTFVPGIGVGKNGNNSWISIAGQSMQPSEFMKLALCVWLGAVLSMKHKLLGQWKHVIIPVVPVVGLALLQVLLTHDLGTAIIMMFLIIGALFVAGIPMRMLVVAVCGLAAAALVFAFGVGNGSRASRIEAWLSPNCDPTKECFQSVHGMMALATGGWFGKGLGASREKWSYLPEAHNDYIFSIIGEELGLVGTLLILFLFAMLCFGMARIIRRHASLFVKITTGGVLTWIVGQALVNIAVVIGFLPVLGVPLPFVSAGGSALIAALMALGMVIAFARTEPGAPEALAARGAVVRRSLAILGRRRPRASKKRNHPDVD